MDKIDSVCKLEEMLDSYQNLVFTICYKMVGDYFAAQDLTQDTFLSAFQSLNTFDGANEKAWLCRIASNKSIDYIKSASRKAIPAESEVFLEKQSESNLPEQTYFEKEVKEILLQNCRKLKPPYNEIAKEYFYNEKRPEEIALETGRNFKTVQTQIYRARGLLRKLYE